jgi:hypothetical protein
MMNPRSTSWVSVFAHDALVLDRHVEEGRFQRSLSAVAGFSGLLGGLEVTLQHYRGSYNQRVMYTPVVLGLLLFAAGVGGAASPRVARTLLPIASVALLADGVIGFGFHVRGIARKPGGWRIPVFNLVMGPPVFAPLLLGVGGLLGVVASMLRPESAPRRLFRRPRSPAWIRFLPAGLRRTEGRLATRVREGRFQGVLAAATAASAALNGVEALYSHYKTNFRHGAQWVPIAIAPPLAAAGVAAVFSDRAARLALAPLSAAAIVAGSVGLFYHARGVVRRPGGMGHPVYNLTYGPPVFAPLLFAASGFLGVLTSMLRRKR